MGQQARILAMIAFLLGGVVPLAAFDGPAPPKGGPAPAKGPAPAAKSEEDASAKGEKDKATTTATRMLDTGIKAYESGDTDEAMRGFNASLKSGLLAPQQVARALYYRGLTRRKQGKPGLAIADLTSAIWLKDGLSPAEKQDALKQRQAAYQAAGISNAPDLGAEAYIASSTSPSVPVTSASSSGGWDTAMTGGPAAPSQSTAPAASPPEASSGGGIGGFFNSITGGLFASSSSSSQESAAPAAATASTANDQPVRGPEVSSWSQTTEVAAQPVGHSPMSAPVTTVAAVQGTPVAASSTSAHKGKYLLQVAAVRSREEADLLVARLLTQHAGELNGREPVIDEAAIGSMGTFYRVRVGPYADASEPKRLCSTFQAGGFDCLVVTR